MCDTSKAEIPWRCRALDDGPGASSNYAAHDSQLSTADHAARQSVCVAQGVTAQNLCMTQNCELR